MKPGAARPVAKGCRLKVWVGRSWLTEEAWVIAFGLSWPHEPSNIFTRAITKKRQKENVRLPF